MKLILLLLIFILPSLYAEHMIPIENEIINFGIINFGGYRSHIFSTGLDKKVINIPDYKVSKKHCTTDSYILAIKPIDNIYYLIGKTKDRQLNLFEWGLILNRNITFKNINTHSESYNGNSQLIHHSLFVKYSGFISVGGGLIMNFSPVYRRGYKYLVHCNYKNDSFDFLSLIEMNEHYITPYNKLQADGWRTKNTFSFKLFNWLSSEFQLSYQDLSKVIKRECSFKLNFTFYSNILTFDTVIKEKDERTITKKHYIESLTLKSDISSFRNTFNFEVNYINALFYKGFNSISLKTFKGNLDIDLKYSWKYIRKAEHFFSTSVKLNRKDWSLNFKYETPLIWGTRKWLIEGSLKQKF